MATGVAKHWISNICHAMAIYERPPRAELRATVCCTETGAQTQLALDMQATDLIDRSEHPAGATCYGCGRAIEIFIVALTPSKPMAGASYG